MQPGVDAAAFVVVHLFHPSAMHDGAGWEGVARGQLQGHLNGKQGAMEARRKNERKQSGPSQVVMRRVSCSERREWWSELLLMDSTRTANSQQLWAHLTAGGNDTETFTRRCDPIMHHKRILNTPSDLPQASDGSITKKHKSGPICILMLNFCFPLRAVRTIIFPRMTLPWKESTIILFLVWIRSLNCKKMGRKRKCFLVIRNCLPVSCSTWTYEETQIYVSD